MTRDQCKALADEEYIVTSILPKSSHLIVGKVIKLHRDWVNPN